MRENRSWLRASYVPQEPSLIGNSIADVIAFSSTCQSDDPVVLFGSPLQEEDVRDVVDMQFVCGLACCEDFLDLDSTGSGAGVGEAELPPGVAFVAALKNSGTEKKTLDTQLTAQRGQECELSGGQQQRLSVARAFYEPGMSSRLGTNGSGCGQLQSLFREPAIPGEEVSPPSASSRVPTSSSRTTAAGQEKAFLATKLYVMDEPCSGLDRPMAARLYRNMSQFAGERGNCAIVLSTHSPAAMRMCTRICFLRNGTVYKVGSYAELSKDPVCAGLMKEDTE